MRNCSNYGGTLLDITYRTGQNKLQIGRFFTSRLYLAEYGRRDILDFYDTLTGLRALPDGSLRTVDGTVLDIIPNVGIKNLNEHKECAPICDVLFVFDPQIGSIDLYKKKGGLGHLSYICEKPAIFTSEEGAVFKASVNLTEQKKNLASIDQYSKVIKLIAVWIVAEKMY